MTKLTKKNIMSANVGFWIINVKCNEVSTKSSTENTDDVTVFRKFCREYKTENNTDKTGLGFKTTVKSCSLRYNTQNLQ